jgi:hypothetical protein
LSAGSQRYWVAANPQSSRKPQRGIFAGIFAMQKHRLQFMKNRLFHGQINGKQHSGHERRQ